MTSLLQIRQVLYHDITIEHTTRSLS